MVREMSNSPDADRRIPCVASEYKEGYVFVDYRDPPPKLPYDFKVQRPPHRQQQQQQQRPSGQLEASWVRVEHSSFAEEHRPVARETEQQRMAERLSGLSFCSPCFQLWTPLQCHLDDHNEIQVDTPPQPTASDRKAVRIATLVYVLCSVEMLEY